MSAGRRCECTDPRHDGERRPPSTALGAAFLELYPEPGLCRRYAIDQEIGGLCDECPDHQPDPA